MDSSFVRMTNALRELLDDRYGECCGLASSCLRTAEEVKSSENDRDRLLLDRSRGCISLFFESLQDRWGELEIGKEHEKSVNRLGVYRDRVEVQKIIHLLGAKKFDFKENMI